ncbi:hypothetical protein [Rhodoferax sp.]|uniref:hypothetical protein n=1 Tax=Rhodoferax sp. TaxID=50421 RepID=UPI001ED3F0D3|nr:hypothetical protein [Rhodoferax sp.]MBT9505510.1 hypothetical protein [Rhodoferax sp.]
MLTTTQAVNHSQETRRAATAPQSFPPLELETRPTVGTAAAAYYLHKQQQTMRIYACRENGPIRPIRVGAHLHWKTDDIRQLLGVSL